MKILYITQLLPFPLDAGGKIKTFSTIKTLSQKHDLRLCTFVQDERDKIYVSRLAAIVGLKKIYFLLNNNISEKNRIKRLVVYLRSLFTLQPYSAYKYYHPEMKWVIAQLMVNTSFDCVWIDHANMIQYLPKRFQKIRVLETHNYDIALYYRLGVQESALIWRAFFFVESLKYYLLFILNLRRFNHIFTISAVDRNRIASLLKRNRNTTLSVLRPPIPERQYIGLQQRKRHLSKILLFVGLLTWYPNRLGVSWFIKRVFPLITKLVPDVYCVIVGNSTGIKRFQSDSRISFVGYVRNIEYYLNQALVYIVPLHSGGGVRIKILEAMAAGIPVVSTSVGAEGIPITNNKNVLIADNAEAFAQCVLLLLKNNNLRRRIALNARQLIDNEYSGSDALSHVENVLSDLVIT